MKNLKQQDQAIEKPTYSDVEIAWQHQEGLLSRPEADVFDVLLATRDVSPVNNLNDGNKQVKKDNEQRQCVLISPIHLLCLWDAAAMLSPDHRIYHLHHSHRSPNGVRWLLVWHGGEFMSWL